MALRSSRLVDSIANFTIAGICYLVFIANNLKNRLVRLIARTFFITKNPLDDIYMTCVYVFVKMQIARFSITLLPVI